MDLPKSITCKTDVRFSKGEFFFQSGPEEKEDIRLYIIVLYFASWIEQCFPTFSLSQSTFLSIKKISWHITSSKRDKCVYLIPYNQCGYYMVNMNCFYIEERHYIMMS